MSRYSSTAFDDPNVATAFDAFPGRQKQQLLAVRDLIYATAQENPEIGDLEETLKWGQPSYLTPKTKSGSTIRLGMAKTGEAAVFVHCQTTILSDFKATFEDAFRYEGKRALLIEDDTNLEQTPLAILIRDALTYHRRKKRT